MIELAKIDELANRLTQALPPAARTMSDEAQAQFRAVLRKGLSSMDVVTREDFDMQKAALARAQEKLEALESRLAELESASP